MTIVLLIAGVILIGLIGLLIRNSQVAKYRLRVIEHISKRSDNDIEHGRDWRWRYEKFDAVTYDQMLKRFWRPLDSFYPDKSFIEP